MIPHFVTAPFLCLSTKKPKKLQDQTVFVLQMICFEIL